MKNFLSNKGLYQEYILIKDYTIGNQNYTSSVDFIGETFEYDCTNCGKATFELDLDEADKNYYLPSGGDTVPSENFIDSKLNYIFKAIGKCKSCNEYHIHFFLNVYSNKPISNILDNTRNIALEEQNKWDLPETNIYVQKVGAFPEIKIIPYSIITKYFGRESNIWYYKGINAINDDYGIGSFSYFRRIVEKELIKIIEDIKSLPDSHKIEIEKLLEKHNENPKVSTIYENIFEHLPHSLKVLGDNPIKLLYNLTSEGLHSLTEQECLEKSKNILKLLDFVIKKINEERSEIKELREVIKNLK